MGTQLQLISTACIVYFGLTYVRPHNQMADQPITSQINDESKVQESFQNLFDSITKNDAKRGKVYRGILNQEITREQGTFDAMKEELQSARNVNTNKRKNFIEKIVVAIKREANESNRYSGFRSENQGEAGGTHDHQHHDHEFEYYADHDPKNESVEWALDPRLVSDPSYHNLIEAVLQLWWSQRGFIHSVRHENEELRRLKYVIINRFNDEVDSIEGIVDKQIESLSLWDKPESVCLHEVMNKTVLTEIQRIWKSAYNSFVAHQFDGAPEITTRIRHELLSASEDLSRRWERIETLMVEIQEQEQQQKEDEIRKRYSQNQ